MQFSQSTLPKKMRDGTQFAALPFRVVTSGRPEIRLLSSRDTGRGVIPKGSPIKGLKPHQVAAQEAYHEQTPGRQLSLRETVRCRRVAL
jgi:hypothetical protein